MLHNLAHRSLFQILAFAISVVIIVSLGTHTFYSYQTNKQQALNELALDTKIVAQSLQKSLVHFISSYAVNEYKKLIEAQMQRESIAAIVVQDHNMQELLSHRYIVGKIRTQKSGIIAYEPQMHEQKLAPLHIKTTLKITDKDQKLLGKVTVYGTQKILQQKLQDILFEHFLVSLMMTLIILLLLFVILHYQTTEPLEKLVKQLQDCDETGMPKNIKISNSSHEIYILTTTILKMIKSLKRSKNKLHESIRHLQETTKLYENEKDELQTVFNYSKVGLAIVDLQSNFLNCNDAFLEIVQYSKKELLQMSALEISLPHEIEKSKEGLAKVKQTGVLKNFEKSYLRKDGTVVNTNLNVALLPDKKRILLSVIDISESIKLRKKLEQLNHNLEDEVVHQVAQLRQKDQMLTQQSKMATMGEMLGNIAHQWRQPLNALSINIQNLDDDFADGLIDEKFINNFIKHQTDTINYMSKTIDDFRNFFKPSKEKKVFNVVEAIKEVINIVSTQLNNHNITIQIHQDKDIEIYGYANEFKQVVINIVNNAKDAIIQKQKEEDFTDGFIDIYLRHLDNKIVISICDNGGGVPQELLNKIFEPYFSTKENKNGTGLGLYMSKAIIEKNMSGGLTVVNKEKGACFEIRLSQNKE